MQKCVIKMFLKFEKYEEISFSIEFETNIPRKGTAPHIPNFHIHVAVSDFYIPMTDLPILLQEICGLFLGIYIFLTDTKCGNWD